ncbi:ABC transporter permease [Spiroplasma sp. DGKH1]|uniref:ABC transporter permease n=1 Tax=Spiroplasma sp. DGKH1 TaxID=3050074 RepID=UPI0034C69D55
MNITNAKKLKSKHKIRLAIILFSMFKVYKSFVMWIIFGLSLILFGTLSILLFVTSKDIYTFSVNFQYGVFIFCNIFLLFFIMLIVIKIFGREIDDGTYLLLISKPYSRNSIFFLKLISLWILIILFLAGITIFSLIIGLITNQIVNKPMLFLKFNELVGKLFAYCLFLSFFAASGILFAVTFMSTQGVMLIVVCFCSLFLLGGLPYSLIMALGNTIELSFSNSTVQNYTVQQINSTINFNDYLKTGKIKYSNITNAIYDFYMAKTPQEIDNIIKAKDSEQSKIERLKFFQSLGLTEKKENTFQTATLTKWEGKYRESPSSNLVAIKDIISNSGGNYPTMQITLSTDYMFKPFKKLDLNNIYQKEIYDLVNETKTFTTWEQLYQLRNLEVASLLYFDPINSTFKINNGENMAINADAGFKISDVFLDLYQKQKMGSTSYRYDGGNTFNNDFLTFFDNPTLYVVKELENNILKKVADYKLIQTEPIKQNNNWLKYQQLMKTYSLISKINIIEHWNQMWTSFINEEPLWFEPLANSKIDFDVQQNKLMSYKSSELKLNQNGTIDLKQKPFLNIYIIISIYGSLSILFLVGAKVILKRKIIL